jgi:hypothetical protein
MPPVSGPMAKRYLVIGWAAKTQLLFSATAGNVDDVVVEMDGARISPASKFELLGATFDQRFSTAPQLAKVLTAVEQRASLVARVVCHIRPGPYIRQVARGLVHGKLSQVLASVATLRLSENDTVSGYDRRIQVQFLFSAPLTERPSRSLSAGLVGVPASGCKTFVRHAAVVWNASAALRAANTKWEAKRRVGTSENLPTITNSCQKW